MDQHVQQRNVLLFGTLGSEPDGVTRDLLSRCREHPVAGRWWLTIAGDAQLQIEHTLELSHKDLAVFLVAGEGPGPAVELHEVRIEANQPLAPSDGPVTPAEVLRTLATLGRRTELPQCYVLTVRAVEAAEAGAPSQAPSASYELLLSLLETPQPEHWASFIA